MRVADASADARFAVGVRLIAVKCISLYSLNLPQMDFGAISRKSTDFS